MTTRPHGDLDRPHAVQRVPGVDAKIEEHLLELDAVRDHVRNFVDGRSEVPASRASPIERGRVLPTTSAGSEMALRSPRRPRGEGEQLLDQVPRTSTRCLRLFEIALELRVAA